MFSEPLSRACESGDVKLTGDVLGGLISGQAQGGAPRNDSHRIIEKSIFRKYTFFYPL